MAAAVALKSLYGSIEEVPGSSAEQSSAERTSESFSAAKELWLMCEIAIPGGIASCSSATPATPSLSAVVCSKVLTTP